MRCLIQIGNLTSAIRLMSPTRLARGWITCSQMWLVIMKYVLLCLAIELRKTHFKYRQVYSIINIECTYHHIYIIVVKLFNHSSEWMLIAINDQSTRTGTVVQCVSTEWVFRMSSACVGVDVFIQLNRCIIIIYHASMTFDILLSYTITIISRLYMYLREITVWCANTTIAT